MGQGEGRLFSLEHFRNVRRALRPGGLYCHWIPAYQVTEEHFRMIAATFLKAFPDAVLLSVDSASGFPQIGLMGGNEAEILVDRYRKTLRRVQGARVGGRPTARR